MYPSNNYLNKYMMMMIVVVNNNNSISVPVAQWLEHCVSSAMVVGSILREHMY